MEVDLPCLPDECASSMREDRGEATRSRSSSSREGEAGRPRREGGRRAHLPIHRPTAPKLIDSGTEEATSM